MVMTTTEMIAKNKEMARQKREHYKTCAERRPKMGTWHTITERAIKVRENDKCNWEREPIEDRHSRHERWNAEKRRYENDSEPTTSYQAMYIGYRYKFNGEWKPEPDNYYEPGEGHYFEQTKTVEVWLFVTHDNRNPIAVFPFEIEQD